jgi:hypothetical protein
MSLRHFVRIVGRRSSMITLCLLLAIGVISSSNTAEAAVGTACGPSWKVFPTATGSGQLTDITSAPGGTLWTVGGGALIEEMTSAGWTAVPANAPTGSTFSSISAASADDIWAVGDYSLSGHAVPLIENWNGSVWTQASAPSLIGYLNGVFALSSTDVWAVGVQTSGAGYYHTLTEHWDGNSWTVVPSPDGTDNSWLNSISGSSSSSVWAVGWDGSSYKKTLAEYWDGVDWRIVPTPSPGNSENVLQDVTSLSATDVWAVGYSGGSRRVTLAEHFNGSTWNAVPTANSVSRTNQLASVSAVSANDIWAVGEYYQGSSWKSLAEYWNGQEWAITTTPNPAGAGEVSAVIALPDGSVWSVSGPQPVARELCPAGITDTGFTSTSITDRGWETVNWVIDPADRSDQSIADATGMGLFNSGALIPGIPYSFTFYASGTYPVTDQAAGAVQTVRVPMTGSPAAGTSATDFTLKWASATAPYNYVYDVQVKSPGVTRFAPLSTGVSTDSASFTPSSGPGTYLFRARLRDTANGIISGWSPSLTISVTS